MFDYDVCLEDIATAFVKVSGGDGRVLNTNLQASKNEEGIWGRALLALFPECENSLAARRFLCNYWNQNRKDIKVSFDNH